MPFSKYDVGNIARSALREQARNQWIQQETAPRACGPTRAQTTHFQTNSKELQQNAKLKTARTRESVHKKYVAVVYSFAYKHYSIWHVNGTENAKRRTDRMKYNTNDGLSNNQGSTLSPSEPGPDNCGVTKKTTILIPSVAPC